MKLIATITIVAALILALPTAGRADPIIVIGQEAFTALTFTAQSPPNGTLTVSSGGFTAGATNQGISGTTTFGTMSWLTGTANAGSPPFFTPDPSASPTEDFNFTAGPNNLDATITWTELTAPALGTEPQLIGAGVINTCSGGAAFDADFCMSAGISIAEGLNFPLSAPNNLCSLADLAVGNCFGLTMETSTLEGGDVNAAPPTIPTTTPTHPVTTVPEPMSTLVALGIALFGLWGTYQLTRRDQPVF